jgi:hypothetical protein
MCQPGNQSIYKQCREAIIKDKGRIRQSDMRAILLENHGCMKKVDNTPSSMIH